jgi:hypothetical protein
VHVGGREYTDDETCHSTNSDSALDGKSNARSPGAADFAKFIFTTSNIKI